MRNFAVAEAKPWFGQRVTTCESFVRAHTVSFILKEFKLAQRGFCDGRACAGGAVHDDELVCSLRDISFAPSLFVDPPKEPQRPFVLGRVSGGCGVWRCTLPFESPRADEGQSRAW